MRTVKKALQAAGYQLKYSRMTGKPGYYLHQQPAVSAELAATLAHSAAELDPAQSAFGGRCHRQNVSAWAVPSATLLTRPWLTVSSMVCSTNQKRISLPDLTRRGDETWMTDQSLGYADFVHLVIEALQAAGIEYLIGGAVAAWAWGEPRSTMDVDIVVNIPFEAIPAPSWELEKRNMPVPVDIILNTLTEERLDLPINAIHMHSGFKADLYPLRPQDELRRSFLLRRISIDFSPPLGAVYVHSPEDLILYKA